MSDTIKQLTIEGFKSIRKLENFQLRSLNVLIGANGAGKSNFVEFFRLLRELVEQRLQVFIGKAGGLDACLYLGPKITRQIAGKVYFGSGGDYGYDFILVPTQDYRLLFSEEMLVLPDQLLPPGDYTPVLSQETIVFHDEPGKVRVPKDLRVALDSGHTEARLKDRREDDFGWRGAARDIVPAWIYDRLSSLRTYHFHDTSPEARVRRQGAINDDEFLRPDAENLAARLYRIQRTDPSHYARIRDVVRLAAPFFDDFKLRPVPTNQELIQLEWLQKDSDHIFLTNQLSDGTLRFICLATALLQPSPPATMVFDEPELGLHPYALTLLASLFDVASKHTSQQVIVATQSAPLVDEFQPEDIIVVERTEGESVFTRLDSKQLAGWLEDYSLGELWQKNVVGGGPRNEAIPLPPDEEAGGNGSHRQHRTSTGDECP